MTYLLMKYGNLRLMVHMCIQRMLLLILLLLVPISLLIL